MIRPVDDFEMPLPIMQTDIDGRFWDRHPPDPRTPWGVACLWWQALQDPVEYLNALRNLSYNPAAWGDYAEAARMIADLGILTKVEDNVDREDIKYVRFMDYAGDSAGIVVDEAPADLWMVTVVKPEGSDDWYVWGLSHNHFPTASQVLGTDPEGGGV